MGGLNTPAAPPFMRCRGSSSSANREAEEHLNDAQQERKYPKHKAQAQTYPKTKPHTQTNPQTNPKIEHRTNPQSNLAQPTNNHTQELRDPKTRPMRYEGLMHDAIGQCGHAKPVRILKNYVSSVVVHLLGGSIYARQGSLF